MRLAGTVAAVVMILTVREAGAERRHAAYVELLGKGGLYGVGWDVRFRPRLAAGATVSFAMLNGQRVTSLSPYLAIYLARSGRHAWFVHGGPQLVNVWTPSPVPEWDGDSSTGVGFQLSSGWEYRGRRWLWRAYAMGAAGQGGIAPWLGGSVGWTF